MLEQQAFDQIIKSEPEFESFRLKVLDLEGKKMSDMGAVSVLTFRVTRLDKMTGQELSRHVLMMYTSNGWMNQFGIDLSLVSWKMLDAEQWNNMYCAFLDLNTPIKIDENYTFNQITEIRR